MADAPQQRLDSLDVFRGLTIAAMILVSTPGTWTAVYTPLDHAAWHGWTMTDLVFPFLLFAMGAAVPYALARRRGMPRLVQRHILRRAIILFALGLILNAIETKPPLHWATFRIPGVLQRIALVYLAVAWLTERVSLRAQIAIAVAALAGYWAALSLIPVPGAGGGVLTPTGNLASFIDRTLLGRHLLDPRFDPEGLLSTVPAVEPANDKLPFRLTGLAIVLLVVLLNNVTLPFPLIGRANAVLALLNAMRVLFSKMTWPLPSADAPC
jgi:predicted acyltransferase